MLQAVQGMSPTRRILLIGAAAVVILAIWWVSRWASDPTYVVLFRDLEFSDAAAIEEQLDKNGIRNRLGAGERASRRSDVPVWNSLTNRPGA